MEEEDLDPRICRICAEKKFLVDMQEDENYHLIKKLREIEEIKKKTDVENFDEVFKYICRSCESALEGFFQFRNRVRKMRRKLMHAAVTGRIAIPAEPMTEMEVEELEEFVEEEPLLEESVKVEQTDDPIFVAEPEFVVIDYLEEDNQLSDEPLEMIAWEDVTTEYPKIPQKDQETPLKIAKEVKIACSQCKPVKREFKDQKALADHIAKVHPPAGKCCPTCGQTFSAIANFLQHLKLHSCSNYQCRYCERVYKCKLNWEIHELGHRTGESEAQEHLRLLRETRAKALNLRIKAKKGGPRKFLKKTPAPTDKPEEKDPRGTECNICGGRYRNMNLHMRVHRSKNYTCLFCYETFKTKGLLRFHTKLNHNTLGSAGSLKNNKDLCRICEDTNYLINVMAPGNEHLYKKLSEIEGMQNDKDYETFSSLFKFICTACENSLEGWHDFRTQCINTRKKLMGFSELEIVEAKSFDDKEEISEDPPRDPLLPNETPDSVDIKEEEDEDCHDYAEEPFDGGFEEEEYKEEVIEVTEPQHIYEHVSTVYPPLTAVEIIKKFLCKDCPKSFNKKISLDRHRVTHPQNKTLCVQCETTFEDRKMLVQHVLWIHEKMKKHYCHKCNRMFANQTDLDAHIESHGLTKFSCPVCQQAFVRMRMLEEHIRTHVTEDVNMDKQITQFVKKPEDAGEDHEKKQKMCHKCGEMYVGEKSNHHRIKHLNDKQPGVSCAICSETFLNLDVLKKHMMIHMKDAPFKCDLCDKSFKYKHKLGYHMETHTGDKKFKCGYCEFGFTRSFQLHNHMRKAHMNEMQGDESSEESEPDKVEEVEDVSVEETEETMEIDEEYLD